MVHRTRKLLRLCSRICRAGSIGPPNRDSDNRIGFLGGAKGCQLHGSTYVLYHRTPALAPISTRVGRSPCTRDPCRCAVPAATLRFASEFVYRCFLHRPVHNGEVSDESLPPRLEAPAKTFVGNTSVWVQKEQRETKAIGRTGSRGLDRSHLAPSRRHLSCRILFQRQILPSPARAGLPSHHSTVNTKARKATGRSDESSGLWDGQRPPGLTCAASADHTRKQPVQMSHSHEW